MKIYTRKGDGGITSLYGGRRVKKNHPLVNAYGTIDELNSLLGVMLAKLRNGRVKEEVQQTQKDLFLIGGSIAGSPVGLEVLPERVLEMEKVIDAFDKNLPTISNFILSRGTEAATLLFLGRAVARRAEREIVSVSSKENIDKKVLVYFNRLSDLLFVMGRYINYKAGIKEEIWKGR